MKLIQFNVGDTFYNTSFNKAEIIQVNVDTCIVEHQSGKYTHTKSQLTGYINNGSYMHYKPFINKSNKLYQIW